MIVGMQDRLDYEMSKIDRELDYLYATSLDEELDEEELFYIEEDIKYLQAQKEIYAFYLKYQ